MYPFNLGILWQAVLTGNRKKIALKYTDIQYSYESFNAMADSLAYMLDLQGCRRGDVIAIGHEKKPWAYALMLACLKLGLPYVNLDSASPLERLARIIKTARPRVLFYDDASYSSIMEALSRKNAIPAVFLNGDLAAPPETWKKKITEKTRAVDGGCIAYIMFTSGSTGEPKGVAVTHQNVLHFIDWASSSFSITSNDIFANLSPMYFDNSVFDFYTALFSGACLAPVGRHLLQSPAELVDYVAKMECSIWFSVPSLLIYLMTMKVMIPERLSKLRSISFGGEGYPKIELKKLFDLFCEQAAIVNVYGPTECTCICSSYVLKKDDFIDLDGLPPLGRLNPNFDHMIESDGQAPGNEGELVLIGPNVSAGYFNDPQRTELAFYTIWDPVRFGKRAYRSGDIVREENGMFYFLGRKDNQIKHMGYRIELEEIENALLRLPGISQAAVVYVRRNTAFGKLFAFAAYTGDMDEKQLLSRLSDFIPQYMLPSSLRLMTHLPKNANGKVDRHALMDICQ